MALEKTPFTVTVAGLRTDIDEHLLPPNAGVLELENAVMSQTGAVSKRPGSPAMTNNLAPTGTMSPTWQLGTHGQTLLSLGKVGSPPLAKYSPTLDLWENLSAGAAPTRGPISVGVMPYAGGANQANNPDIALSGNYVANTFEYSLSTNLSYEQIIDGQTGKVIAQATPAGVNPKVLCVNGAFVFIWVDPSSHNITFDKWVVANLGTTSAPTQTTVAASAFAGSDPYIDVQQLTSDKIIVVYSKSDGHVWSVDYTVSTATAGSLVQLRDSGGSSIQSSQCLGWLQQSFATGPALIIADSGSGVKVHNFNVSGSAVVATAGLSTTIDAGATTNIRNVTGWTTGATDFVVLFETTGTNPWQSFITASLKVGASVTKGVWHRGLILRSKPVTNTPDGQVYIVCGYDSTTQPLYVLMPVSSDPVTNTYPIAAARFRTWSAGGKTEKASCLPSLLAYGSGAIYPAVYKTRLESASGSIYFDYGLAIETFSFNDTTLSRPKEANGCLWAPGGVLHAYDGSRFHEHIFHTYPEGLSVTFSNTGGGGLNPGDTHEWIAVYRWINAQGQIVRSAPSAPVKATVTGGNNTALVNVPNCRLTSIHDISPQIELYRIQNGGVTYYHTKDSRFPYTENVYQASTDNQIQDTTSDADLVSGELLYAQPGGVLASQPPPPVISVDVFDDRLWGIHAEDKTLLVYTQQFVDGQAASFNEALGLRIRDQYGDLTATAVMGSTFLTFKEKAIAAVVGQGPDTSGRGGYNQPQLVVIGDGVASTAVKSIIVTTEGVYFISARGLCLLSPGLQVDVLSPFQQYLPSFVCTGAVHLPQYNQIRWFSSGGTTLVWDYLHKISGIHTGQPTNSAKSWQNTVVTTDATGANRYKEVPGTFTDRGAQYALKVTFPWLLLAGLKGYVRLYRLMGIGSAPNGSIPMNIIFTFDFDPSTAHTQTVTPTVLWDWEARPAKPLASAFKITFVEASPNGAGPVIVGFTCVYGVKKGLKPVNKAHRAV